MTRQTLAEKRESYVVDLREALQRIVVKLAARPEVHRVVLFGSYAAGRRDLFTDLDLLVVMDSKLDFVTRTAELYGSLQAGVDLDLVVYTPEEFDRMRDRRFLKHALKESEILYERR